MRFHIYFPAFILSSCAAFGANAADLWIDVSEMRSGRGDVHVAVYADPKTFPSSKGMIADVIVPAREKGTEAVFTGLAPGTYALAAYHDENGDHEFNQIFWGLPIEGFGFSNGAKVFFGPPDFEEAAVNVGEGVSRIGIAMDYWLQ
ncbi:MAG: hypothetical protein A3G18_00450 [Rhodospirillales bacterium RIFCSPLOWO2_12_FULL_58_28]|nr:MAG: hypothetical protein A3H92_03055 [Rhodospirillales bacterium RIFCSPLOWO2_02_FULL_58_16]OHC79932.1 MAG: hypothetical protein A3G18_00450 [Rhodospirillales bacterium RIFCSPLOWO2_12_FULL_58_28]